MASAERPPAHLLYCYRRLPADDLGTPGIDTDGDATRTDTLGPFSTEGVPLVSQVTPAVMAGLTDHGGSWRT